jgi:putative YphP/YqiW family bacilliredoxin
MRKQSMFSALKDKLDLESQGQRPHGHSEDYANSPGLRVSQDADLPPIYDPEAVQPMIEELTRVGIRHLASREEVDGAIGQKGTTLAVINSVCGCAAGNARPGVQLALQHEKIPDRLTTVFAGVTRAAVEQARSHMPGVAPSSPCIALFKDGAPVHILERRHIELMSARQVAENLAEAFDMHCAAPGPSIPRGEFEKLPNMQVCGSSVPPPQG